MDFTLGNPESPHSNDFRTQWTWPWFAKPNRFGFGDIKWLQRIQDEIPNHFRKILFGEIQPTGPPMQPTGPPMRMQGWESVCWGGTPYFRLFNVIWYLPSPYYRLFNVLWNLPSPYYRLINVLWLPFLKIKKFRVPSLTKSLGYLPGKKFRVHSLKTQSLG